jgi:hypothetical protein
VSCPAGTALRPYGRSQSRAAPGACGARCTGRFAGCASILEQPGFVPESAPDWALQSLPAPAPIERFHGPGHRGAAASAATAPGEAGADVAAIVRAELGSTADTLREIVAQALANPRNAIDTLRVELVEHSEDRERSAATAEGLTRVARRVGRWSAHSA